MQHPLSLQMKERVNYAVRKMVIILRYQFVDVMCQSTML